MADDRSDFDRMVDEFRVGDLDFVRHNETDFEAFRNFSKVQNERYEAARKAKELQDKKKNLLRWLQQVPERWRKASLKTFDGGSIGSHQSSVDAVRRKLKAKQRGFIISGPHTSGKSYLAYAIVREFVAHGKLKPSQIKVITEGDLLSLANGGYESRDAFEDVFDPRFKCYIFDSMGTRKEYDDRREAPALARLIEEAYNRSALFIGTTHMDFDLYESGLPEQAAAKLRHMVKDGIVYTGQPLYGKNDERRDLTLDVDGYNLTGELSYLEDAVEKKQSAPKSTKKSGGGSWRDRTARISD